MNTYTVYDATGRKTKSVGNYVAQATPPDQWVWREVSGVFGWRLSLTNDTLVSHGANKDENIITSNKYDLAGRVKEVRDTLGRLTQYTYDAVGRLTKTIANFVDGVFSSSATDEDITSQTVYNKAGQVMNTTDPHGTMTEFAYDVAGRRVSIKHAKNTALESVNYTCFNKAGWVLRTISNTIATATSPDAKTGTAWDFNPTAHGTYNDENLITEYEFDTLGRQTKVINPLGEFTSTTYAKDGSVMTVTDPEGTVTAYRYDKLRRRRMIVQGYVANGQDPANWVWDATDARWEESNMINVKVEHGTDNDQNIIVQLTHDIAGRVLTMRNPRGHVTSYAYDNLNRRIQLQNPLGNTWLTSYEELGDGGRRTVTTYPENTTPVPFKTTREFDRMGRLMSIGYGDYAVTNTPNVQFGYDVLGNRTSMSELGVVDALIRQTQFEYDDARRMKTVGYDSDGDAIINETVSYEYDERGLRTKLTFDGKNITYVYDAKGRLISMTDWDSRTTTYDYDDVNRHRLTSRQNGVTSAYAHNTAGGLTDIHHKNSSNATLARFTYTLDGRGHRTQANETLNGSPKTVTYAYDQLARVKNAKYYTGTVPTGTPADEYAYTFDVAGNRLSESHAVNGGTPTVTNYTYNSANRLTNAGYTYDANGNLTNNGVSSYTWDRANRLISVGDSTNGFTDYAYDGIGNRLSKTIGASITEYLVDMQPSLAVILREKIGSDNTHYVHGLRGIASQHDGVGWSDAVSDGLGSVRGWLNGSQTFVSDVDYNPYGVPSGAVDDFGFTGEMTDDNGLVYLRARYYDPNVGVFASLDPFEGVHNRPMSMNGYSWVEGNVANWVDPSGQVCASLTDRQPGQSAWDLNVTHCETLRQVLQTNRNPTFDEVFYCYECAMPANLGNSPESYELGLRQAVADGLTSEIRLQMAVEEYRRSYNARLIIPADISWGNDGYIEGYSFIIGGYEEGEEIVYNFSTFQRSRFAYRGLGIGIPSVGGNIYYGIVEGFVEDYSNQFEGGAFLGQYNGTSSSRPSGGGFGLPGVGATYFHGWDGEYPGIQGNTFYIGASVAPSLFGFSVDLGQWWPYYWDTGYRKSYANDCKVNIAELRSDILSGNGSPVNVYLAESLTVARNIALAFAESKIVGFENNCRKKKTQC